MVSSHSYVVGGGGGGVGGCSGGGLVGVRVDASPLISSITDSVLDLTRLGTSPLFVRTVCVCVFVGLCVCDDIEC